MATNTKKNLYNKKKQEPEAANRFDWVDKFTTDQRIKLSIGLLFMVLSLVLTASFISYLFTCRVDQSTVESLWTTGVINSGREIQNWLGLLGAIVSHVFIYQWFGIGAILFVPFVFNIGYRLIYHRPMFAEWRLMKSMLFGMFWLSLFLGYIVVNSDTDGFFSFYCGRIGYEMALLLNNMLGFGTGVLIFFLAVIFLIFSFDLNSIIRIQEAIHKQPQPLSATDAQNPVKKDQPVKKEEKTAPVVNPVVNKDEPLTPEPKKEQGKKPVDLKKPADDPKKPGEPQPHDLETPLYIAPKDDTSKPDLGAEPEFSVEDRSEFNEKIVDETTLDENDKNAPAYVRFGYYDPRLELGSYQYPDMDLLDPPVVSKVRVTKEELESNKDRIVETLSHFRIGISSIKATIGPTVTLYEIVPQAGIKISKIKNLEDDIALSLSALGIRIIAPIPGRGTIGIEVPNKNRESVSISSVLATEKFIKSEKELPVVLGKTISNEVFVTDLAKMPHLLMAGATGQGKSVGLNVILTSLIYKKHPAELKFVLVDPKKVELTLFNKIERHFLATLPNAEEPIITDTRKVVNTLNSLCIEMDVRYDLLKDAGCRNIKEYNEKFVKRALNPEEGHRYLPYIVLVIDELADLMMTAGKEVETPIARLAQLARAIGIHLVVATQRPSVNVITGIIKANFPARLSFKVSSKIDSRTILDTGGADQLIGQGDMLLSNGSDIIRLQCAYVDTQEVERICEFIGNQRGYATSYLLPEFEEEGAESKTIDLSNRDSMFEEAARLVVLHQQGSTSLIQRKLSLGYNRAGRIIDQLEAAGIVGPFEGSKARKVLISDDYSLEQLLNTLV